MTGKEYRSISRDDAAEENKNDIVLEVKNISTKALVNNVSFHIRKGEVLGLAGLVGSGRSETARAIFGADPRSGGEIFIHGKKVRIKNPKQAKKHGIGFVMEDRKTAGLHLKLPIYENVTMTNLLKYKKLGFIRRKGQWKQVNTFRDLLQIKTDNIKNPVLSLSGGNQQKVSIAKWMHIEPEILILDEPTRGVDVGAKGEIYKLINILKEQGKAILLISSEFAEILGLSDRVMVIKNGEVKGEFTGVQIRSDSSVLDAL
jgi:ribose transport system ATP-binding protein